MSLVPIFLKEPPQPPREAASPKPKPKPQESPPLDKRS